MADQAITVELSPMEAATVAEYLSERAHTAPLGHAETLRRVAARLGAECDRAETDRQAKLTDATARRVVQLQLEDEAREVGRSVGYDHANYVNAHANYVNAHGGGALKTDASITVPGRYATVHTHYVAAYIEGQDAYEDEQHEDED